MWPECDLTRAVRDEMPWRTLNLPGLGRLFLLNKANRERWRYGAIVSAVSSQLFHGSSPRFEFEKVRFLLEFLPCQ